MAIAVRELHSQPDRTRWRCLNCREIEEPADDDRRLFRVDLGRMSNTGTALGEYLCAACLHELSLALMAALYHGAMRELVSIELKNDEPEIAVSSDKKPQ